MTQAPGSCDKPLARDNKQRQTNPETLPGLAGLQAAWLRQGTGRGGGLPPAQLLPRHPDGHQRKATAALVPLGSTSSQGCCWRGSAPQPQPHPSSCACISGRQVPCGTMATSLQASPTHHTSRPQPSPTACSRPRGFGAGDLSTSPSSPCKRRGWAGWEVPPPPHGFEEATYRLLTRESCLLAAQRAAPGWPPRKTLG